MMTGTEPPSTLQAAPATEDARSEHRKTMASAISSISASRPIGRPAPTASTASSRESCPPVSIAWSSRPPGDIHSSVFTGPGQIALTSTPRFAYTSAKTRDSESSAALATEYSGVPVVGRLPALEQTFTTLPQPRSAMAGSAARIARMGAITLSSQAAFHSSSVTSSSERRLAVPALFASTSRRPNRSEASATMRSPASGSVMSKASPCAPPPALEHLDTASSSVPAERATNSTLPPSPQSRSATASPMPRLAPVTTQALPSSPRSISAPWGRSLDQLDTIGDADLAVVGQQAMDRTLAGDPMEALDLILRQPVGEPDDDLERPRDARLAVLHLHLDLHLAEVPPLASGVHLGRDRGAGRQGGRDGASGGGALVTASGLLRLVDHQAVSPLDLDVVRVPLTPPRGDLNHRRHRPRGPRRAPDRRRRRTSPSRRRGQRPGSGSEARPPTRVAPPPSVPPPAAPRGGSRSLRRRAAPRA